jgi:Cdc6-like AAA superfamily ATPase
LFWEFWNKHQETAQYVDFVTVHILPYWEDNPVAIDNAVNHASNIMNQLAGTFKKPILIGETGVGKSVIARQLLLEISEKANYTPIFLNFTAQTSSKRTQEMIESKLEKKRRNLLGAPKNKRLIIFIDDCEFLFTDNENMNVFKVMIGKQQTATWSNNAALEGVKKLPQPMQKAIMKNRLKSSEGFEFSTKNVHFIIASKCWSLSQI